MRPTGPQRPRQEFGLDKHELPVADFFLKQRVNGLLLLTLLVGRDQGFACNLGQFHRAAIPGDEMHAFEFPAIQEGQSQTFDPRPKLLHQVQRQRLPTRPVGVQEADKRVEAGGGQRGDAIVA